MLAVQCFEGDGIDPDRIESKDWPAISGCGDGLLVPEAYVRIAQSCVRSPFKRDIGVCFLVLPSPVWRRYNDTIRLAKKLCLPRRINQVPFELHFKRLIEHASAGGRTDVIVEGGELRLWKGCKDRPLTKANMAGLFQKHETFAGFTPA